MLHNDLFLSNPTLHSSYLQSSNRLSLSLSHWIDDFPPFFVVFQFSFNFYSSWNNYFQIYPRRNETWKILEIYIQIYHSLQKLRTIFFSKDHSLYLQPGTLSFLLCARLVMIFQLKKWIFCLLLFKVSRYFLFLLLYVRPTFSVTVKKLILLNKPYTCYLLFF